MIAPITGGGWIPQRARGGRSSGIGDAVRDADAVDLTWLDVGLFVAVVAGAEVGLALGRRADRRLRTRTRGHGGGAGAGRVASVVGAEEANAIGSVGDFALMLPREEQAATLSTLQAYAEVRLALGRPDAAAALRTSASRSAALLGQVWQGRSG